MLLNCCCGDCKCLRPPPNTDNVPNPGVNPTPIRFQLSFNDLVSIVTSTMRFRHTTQLTTGTGITDWLPSAFGMFLYASNSKALIKFTTDYGLDFDLAGDITFYDDPGTNGAVFQCSRVDGEDTWELISSSGQLWYIGASPTPGNIVNFSDIAMSYGPAVDILQIPEPILCSCATPIPGSFVGSGRGKMTTEGWKEVFQPINGITRELSLVNIFNNSGHDYYEYRTEEESGLIDGGAGTIFQYSLLIRSLVVALPGHYNYCKTSIFYRLRVPGIGNTRTHTFNALSGCFPYRAVFLEEVLPVSFSENPFGRIWRTSGQGGFQGVIYKYGIGRISSII